ncbi:MAG TPA: ATP-dependent DNA helicase DinG [Cerasibacillus sp.]|uniref:ATP-dependent DNA helicase DinG n=1 Tax=Cerasibacillus sp. TaxID=2498711 RepID=UPI002F41448A
MQRFVVVDLETTGHSPAEGDKIIEVGIVVIENETITDTYSTLINPGQPIPPFISQLTNIRDKDVKDAPMFSEKAEEISRFFESAYLIAHNAQFDHEFLNAMFIDEGYAPLRNPVLDTVELARIFFPTASGFKLNQLADYLQVKHDMPHRALSDAYVTAEIFLKIIGKLKALPFETISHLLELEPFLKSDLFALLEKEKQVKAYQNNLETIAVYKGVPFRKNEQTEVEATEQSTSSYGDLIDDIYAPNGSLKQTLTHYEVRPGQKDMSELIYDIFRQKKHGLIEATTGTGKSLAYLIPAIYEAVSLNERIVISTYTTQLQSQLLEEDIPILKAIIPFPFRVSLLKGKRHYISLDKFVKELAHSAGDHYGIVITKAMILVWLTETTTGDIDEIHLPSSGYYFFRKVSAESEDINDVKSAWHRYSYYQKAHEKASKANLIITNHALLCADIVSKHIYLPRYNKAIIDEAHHLEETASHYFGLQFDYMQNVFVLNQIGASNEGKWMTKIANIFSSQSTWTLINQWDSLFTTFRTELDDVFRSIHRYVLKHCSESYNDIGRLQYQLHDRSFDEPYWQSIAEDLTSIDMMAKELCVILEQIMSYPFVDSYISDQIKQSLNLIEATREQLNIFFLKLDDNQIKWIEIEATGAKNAVYIYAEPKNTATILKEKFFDEKQSIILTSATLTMKQSFRFVQEQLGLIDQQLIKEQIQSPFNFEKQVQLLIPSDFPDIRTDPDEFIYSSCEAILSLAEITKGRMLVLFTSYDMLKRSYYILKEMFQEDFTLVAQGITSGSRARLKKKFQSFEKGILLGTSSFWEGIDIPGDALSCLVIVRLPFQPPNHPVYKAKANELKQTGKNAFYHLALPHAVIRFKQGFGRLIRSKTDRGLVFVCDSRLKTATYGSFFLNSIQKLPVHYDTTYHLIKKADTWFNHQNLI